MAEAIRVPYNIEVIQVDCHPVQIEPPPMMNLIAASVLEAGIDRLRPHCFGHSDGSAIYHQC